MDLEKINRDLEQVDHALDQRLNHSNVINSNNIIIQEDPKSEKKADFHIMITILVFILIMVLLLFIASFINGDKVLN